MMRPQYKEWDMAIDAKEAVQAAFHSFDEFVGPTGGGTIKHKLLEELKYDDGNWRVVIGFAIGREKTTNALNFGMGRELSPIREYRTFIIDGETGKMIELSSI